MERAAGIMGCSASVSASPNSIVSEDISKHNGHSRGHEPTNAPASTPEPEIAEADGVQRRVSDTHLFQRIKNDIERANEFTRKPLQLDNGDNPFLPVSHLPRNPVITIRLPDRLLSDVGQENSRGTRLLFRSKPIIAEGAITPLPHQ